MRNGFWYSNLDKRKDRMTFVKPTGPTLWDEVLAPLLAAFPNNQFVVAGGAVRDFMIDPRINAKDIDIFTDVKTPLELEMGLQDVRSLQPARSLNKYAINDKRFLWASNAQKLQEYSLQKRDDEQDMAALVDVLSYRYIFIYENNKWGENIPVQIMIKTLEDEWSAEKLVETFDHTRVQCWYDPKKKELFELDNCKRDREKTGTKAGVTLTTNIQTDPKKRKKTTSRIRRWKNRHQDEMRRIAYIEKIDEARKAKEALGEIDKSAVWKTFTTASNNVAFGHQALNKIRIFR